MVSGGNQPVFKGFYGNPGVKSFLPHAKTLDLYAYIQQRKCLYWRESREEVSPQTSKSHSWKRGKWKVDFQVGRKRSMIRGKVP